MHTGFVSVDQVQIPLKKRKIYMFTFFLDNIINLLGPSFDLGMTWIFKLEMQAMRYRRKK